MQNVTCVELKIAANAITEDAFTQLMQVFNAIGGSEETLISENKSTRVAWFEALEDQEEQYLRLTTAARLLGVQEEHINIQTLNDDWAKAWQKNWSAMPIGQALCVRPPFCAPLTNRNIDIVLDPGMAFGTGTHPTTYLCLEAIERYCLHQPPQSVLDMGAGSGLLAIAAGKMGAKDIHAIDYDPLSVDASETNANINNVTLTATLSSTPPRRQFELVIANILAGPLLNMAQKLTDTVEKHLILSGLLTTQVTAIIQAYEKAGLRHQQTHTKQGWATIEFSH